jgi:hypothetical protein
LRTEADLLSDRIAILARGRLACCGSPRFLRARLGLGHHLSLLLSPAAAEGACGAAQATALVTRHAPAAVRAPPVARGELSFVLPGCDAATLAKVLRELDVSGDAIGVAGISVSCPTLEEVFLSVSETVSGAAAGDVPRLSVQSLRDAALARLRASADTLQAAAALPAQPAQLLGGGALLARQFSALLRKRALNARRDRLACATSLAVPLLFVCLGLALSRLGTPPSTYPPALLGPAFLAHKPLAAALSPAASAAAGGDVSAFDAVFGASALAWAAGADSVWNCSGGVEGGDSWYPYCEPEYSDCAAMGCTPPGAATDATLDAALLAATQRRRNCAQPQPQQPGERAPPPSSCAAVYVAAVAPAARRFAFTLALSPDAYFALPAAQALVDSAVYSSLLGRPARLALVLHPLPEAHAGAQQGSGGGGGGGGGMALELLVGLCVILALGSLSASAAVFLVAERRSRSKHQQLRSGVRRATFWAATAAWDAASTALPLAAVRALRAHVLLGHQFFSDTAQSHGMDASLTARMHACAPCVR